MNLLYNYGRLIDSETGEVGNLPVGVRICESKEKTTGVPFGGKGWIKVFGIPRELSKSELSILSWIMSNERLRSADNAIIKSNRDTADAAYISSHAGIESSRTGRSALAGLRSKRIVEKRDGVWFLNPYIAYKGGGVALSTLDMFKDGRKRVSSSGIMAKIEHSENVLKAL